MQWKQWHAPQELGLELEEMVAEALSLDEDKASAELSSLENESGTAAQNVIAASALT